MKSIKDVFLLYKVVLAIMDASYNPLSINEDYFFPVTADGRGSDVEVLQGGQNLVKLTI
jgi:hypothetical protein